MTKVYSRKEREEKMWREQIKMKKKTKIENVGL